MIHTEWYFANGLSRVHMEEQRGRPSSGADVFHGWRMPSSLSTRQTDTRTVSSRSSDSR